VSTAYVAGIGVCAPGLPGWEAGRAVLAGSAPFAPEPVRLGPPALLAPNERRRAGTVVRLALRVAGEAAGMAGLPAAALRNVFASANGDGAVIHAMLEELAKPDPQLSPTQFHNSVHNAPSGYWAIGNAALSPVTCLGCGDATVAAALLKAAAEVAVERSPVLLCLYDAPAPPPLAAILGVEEMFGAALVLLPEPGPAPLARLDIAWSAEPAPGPDALLPALRPLHDGNPSARILPLLQALARPEPGRLAFPLLEGSAAITVTPCSTDAASPR
jgi:hypothetical protein